MSQFSDDFLQELLRLSPEERERRMREALSAAFPQVDQSGQAGGATGGAGNTYGENAQIGATAEQHVGAIRAGRDTFVATQQTIHCYFGTRPPDDAGELLSDYLETFAEECDTLRLQRITGQRQKGNEQAAVPELRLQDVYTSLTTDGPPVVRLRTRVTAGRARRFLERLEKAGRAPDNVSPERVIRVAVHSLNDKGSAAGFGERLSRDTLSLIGFDQIDDETELNLELQRAELAVEAIARQRRLVLLGEPGSGKSTVLRYLGHLLARRACGEPLRLPGWDTDDTPIPILLPLAQVAETLEKTPDPDEALWQTLGVILDGPQGLSADLRDSLRESLRRGGVVLLCDGLDELSAEGGDRSPRTLVSQALQRLVRRTKAKARVVVTSRILPYDAPGSWQLPSADRWVRRTITPLAFGQVRAFVHSWFRSLADHAADLSREEATRQATELIAQLNARPSLAPLVESPLLLTMLALLHDNDRVPDQEVDLYERCVVLLLDRWEPVRQPGITAPRPGLIARLGNPPGLTLSGLRNPLHALAFEAHRTATGEEGRSVISDELLRGRLVTFFDRLGLADPLGACKIFEQVLSMEAGLLVARGDTAFAFPHLSFQEYLAACYLAGLPETRSGDEKQPTMREVAYAVWQSDDRERWRKTLVLLASCLAVQKKATGQGLLWLKQLWGDRLGDGAKAAPQYYQDVRLAALTYRGIGGRAEFAASEQLDLQAEITQPLQRAIARLLSAAEATIPLEDRLIAGRVLGDLGDPRAPVDGDAWRGSLPNLSHTFTATGDHYWRYLPERRYRIGGWEDGAKSAEHSLSAFWVARLPVTVAQFARFVEAGYREDRHWTPNGLAWRRDRSAPRLWSAPRYSGLNQPIVGVTWYEAVAFCRWLTEQLATVLPAGHELRLPTEAEWEVAAAYDGTTTHRTYPWDKEELTPERAVYDAWKPDAPAPVGLCPAGAAACGALDLAGNVWEWCASHHTTYPDRAYILEKDFTASNFVVPVRGGAYWDNSTNIRCGARSRGRPVVGVSDYGFRVVVSPRLAHMS